MFKIIDTIVVYDVLVHLYRSYAILGKIIYHCKLVDTRVRDYENMVYSFLYLNIY